MSAVTEFFSCTKIFETRKFPKKILEKREHTQYWITEHKNGQKEKNWSENNPLALTPALKIPVGSGHKPNTNPASCAHFLYSSQELNFIVKEPEILRHGKAEFGIPIQKNRILAFHTARTGSSHNLQHFLWSANAARSTWLTGFLCWQYKALYSTPCCAQLVPCFLVQFSGIFPAFSYGETPSLLRAVYQDIANNVQNTSGFYSANLSDIPINNKSLYF